MEYVKRANAIAMKDGQEYHAILLYVSSNVVIKGIVHTVENVYVRLDSEETIVMKDM